MRYAILTALVAGALLTGCGSSGKSDTGSTTAATAAKPTSSFKIKNYLYVPASATVKVGQKVSVTDEDSTSHTFTDKGTPSTFDSGTIKSGQTKTVTFTKVGTFKVYCQFHPTMSATVTVIR